MLNTWNLEKYDWTTETITAICYGVEPPEDP